MMLQKRDAIFNFLICLLISIRIEFIVSETYPCHFASYLATCPVQVSDTYPVEVTAIFNHCHKPMDITFILKVVDQKVDWKYTYVTTNQVETPEIPGFLPDHNVALRVQMGLVGKDAVNVTADFHFDDKQDTVIMNTTVRVSTFEDCAQFGNNLTGRILLGVLLTCVMLTLCGFITVYVYRHRSDKSDRFPLVDDAEAVARASTSFTIVANNNNGHSASSSPEEPDFLMAAKDQPTRSHLNVEYHPISMIALDSSPTNIII